MPNHVTTRCLITGSSEVLAHFKERMWVPREGRPQEQAFDFNGILPMPAILSEVPDGTDAELGAALLKMRDGWTDVAVELPSWAAIHIQRELGSWSRTAKQAAQFLAQRPGVEAAGQLRVQALRETGFASWHPWSIAHWGTKWNAYSLQEVSETPTELHFTFQTAWSFPTPVFEALAQAYPGLHFSCTCFDDGSNFAGVGAFNPHPGEDAFAIVKATDYLYEIVYGQPPDRDEDD